MSKIISALVFIEAHILLYFARSKEAQAQSRIAQAQAWERAAPRIVNEQVQIIADARLEQRAALATLGKSYDDATESA